MIKKYKNKSLEEVKKIESSNSYFRVNPRTETELIKGYPMGINAYALIE